MNRGRCFLALVRGAVLCSRRSVSEPDDVSSASSHTHDTLFFNIHTKAQSFATPTLVSVPLCSPFSCVYGVSRGNLIRTEVLTVVPCHPRSKSRRARRELLSLSLACTMLLNNRVAMTIYLMQATCAPTFYGNKYLDSVLNSFCTMCSRSAPCTDLIFV